jgi:DNA-binding transcriptional regulator YiaG
MIEDDQTVQEMRGRDTPAPRSFMTASEMRSIRATVLRVTQGKLAEQLIKPTTGEPVTTGMVSRWEIGERPVPLWAARRIRDLAEAARRYDARRAE